MSEERRRTGGSAQGHGAEEIDRIDLSVMFHDFFRGMKKFWFLVLLLTVALGGLNALRAQQSYVPLYRSSASFTVTAAGGTTYYYDQNMASQMSATFPYLLESELLTDRVKETLGTQVINGTISASNTESSNLFTLTVTSRNPEDALAILQAVVANYEDVAWYVLGEIDLTVLEEPTLATAPYNSPTTLRSGIKGAVIGLALGLALIGIYAMMRRTVRHEEDVHNVLQVQCLGVIPKIHLRKKRKKGEAGLGLSVLNHDTGETFQESLRGIALREDKLLKERQAKVLMVTAAAPGEGTTTAANNLAWSLAELGRRVILIDADLRATHPDWNAAGLEELLRGKARVKEAVVRERRSTVLKLCCKKPVEQRELAAAAERLGALLQSLRNQSDYIILDTPPCTRMSDVVIAAENADSLVFVVRQDNIPAYQVADDLEEICSFGVHMDGCILSQVVTGLAGYGYGKYSKYYGRYAYRKYGYGSYGYGQRSYGYYSYSADKEREDRS